MCFLHKLQRNLAIFLAAATPRLAPLAATRAPVSADAALIVWGQGSADGADYNAAAATCLSTRDEGVRTEKGGEGRRTSGETRDGA